MSACKRVHYQWHNLSPIWHCRPIFLLIAVCFFPVRRSGKCLIYIDFKFSTVKGFPLIIRFVDSPSNCHLRELDIISVIFDLFLASFKETKE